MEQHSNNEEEEWVSSHICFTMPIFFMVSTWQIKERSTKSGNLGRLSGPPVIYHYQLVFRQLSKFDLQDSAVNKNLLVENPGQAKYLLSCWGLKPDLCILTWSVRLFFILTVCSFPEQITMTQALYKEFDKAWTVCCILSRFVKLGCRQFCPCLYPTKCTAIPWQFFQERLCRRLIYKLLFF